jgi:hypothetical protein
VKRNEIIITFSENMGKEVKKIIFLANSKKKYHIFNVFTNQWQVHALLERAAPKPN